MLGVLSPAYHHDAPCHAQPSRGLTRADVDRLTRHMGGRLRRRHPPRGLFPRPVLDDGVPPQPPLIRGRPPTTVDPKPDTVPLRVHRRAPQRAKKTRLKPAHRRYPIVENRDRHRNDPVPLINRTAPSPQ
ncbi:hypothetical protein Acsp03_47440 [Actinomadura sp. NBRC 104412]|nr:hypothetical protein Acsp03_47440 [Actinomadura sp. NBRC 104412]